MRRMYNTNECFSRLLQQFINLLVGLETSALFLLLLNYVFVVKLLYFHIVTAPLSKPKFTVNVREWTECYFSILTLSFPKTIIINDCNTNSNLSHKTNKKRCCREYIQWMFLCSWINNCQIVSFVAYKQRMASLSFFQLSAVSWNMHFLSLYFWTHHVSKFAKRFLATVRITLSKNHR